MALTHKQAREALVAGDRLFASYPRGDKPDEKVSYALLGQQKTVNLGAAQKLLAEGLTPVGDGLLGDSQTFLWDAEKASGYRDRMAGGE